MRSPEFGPLYRSGECDRCHFETVKTLYGFEEDEEGGWQYCGGCAEKISRHRAEKIRLADSRPLRDEYGRRAVRH